MKVVLTENDNGYARFLRSSNFINGGKIEYVDVQDFLKGTEVDLIIFTGGQDVSPELYGDSTCKETYSHGSRDLNEIYLYNEALRRNVPKLGICRGSQFITAMQPGGMLIQDVKNHNNMEGHLITDTRTNKDILVTSSHHQMMYPFNVKNHEVIAYSTKRLSDRYTIGSLRLKGEENQVAIGNQEEPEIVYYKDSNSLCIQGHPEWVGVNSDFATYSRELIKELLL